MTDLETLLLILCLSFAGLGAIVLFAAGALVYRMVKAFIR